MCIRDSGVIDDKLVYVYSQDASVLNGTVGEMHAKKITRLYDLAMKTGAPVIGLVDCAGIRLQEATDALEAFGQIYLKQTLASGVIPQITAIFGTCGGGMAVIPSLTDFTFMESKKGKMFVNTPNALEGNLSLIHIWNDCIRIHALQRRKESYEVPSRRDGFFQTGHILKCADHSCSKFLPSHLRSRLFHYSDVPGICMCENWYGLLQERQRQDDRRRNGSSPRNPGNRMGICMGTGSWLRTEYLPVQLESP